MARPRSSKGTQGSRPGEAPKPDVVKLKLSLDREVCRLLRLEAFGRDVSLGRVVEDLVRSSPRRFVLVDRARGSQGTEATAPPSLPRLQEARGEPPTLGVVSEAG